MSEPVIGQPVVAPVDEHVPATTEQPAAEEAAPVATITTEEAPKTEEPAVTAAATEPTAAEVPKGEKRKSKILDLFNKIKVSSSISLLPSKRTLEKKCVKRC
jgi:hypothetical protein